MLHVKTPLVFPVVFGLFGLLLVYVTLDLLFGLVHRSTLTLPHSAVSDIRLNIGMQTTAGRSQPYYDIELVMSRGKNISAGKYIRNKREAEWIAARMRARLASG